MIKKSRTNSEVKRFTQRIKNEYHFKPQIEFDLAIRRYVLRNSLTKDQMNILTKASVEREEAKKNYD